MGSALNPECLKLAERRHPGNVYECLLWRKQSLRFSKLAAASDPDCVKTRLEKTLRKLGSDPDFPSQFAWQQVIYTESAK